MAAKGFHAAIDGHVVNATAPVDINGSAVDSDVWTMEHYSHASICVMLGVTGAATTITLEECTAIDGTGATAIAFEYYSETTAAGDTLSARTTATTAGITGSTNDGVMYIIEIDASELSADSPFLRVAFTDPSAATLASVTVILSGARYAGESSATAIA